MNVLYLHTHDSGRCFSPYGYALPTPNIHRLAKEGTLLRQCYSCGPTCSPSRVGLLAGMAPHTAGMLGLAHRGFAMHDYSVHLAPFLGRNGYETVLCGIQHEAPDAAQIGYERILDTQGYNMGQVTEDFTGFDRANARAVAAFLTERGRGDGRPLFLSYGIFNTHRQYPDYHGRVDPDTVAVPFPLYDCPQVREDMAGYAASAAVADECVGTVLEALRSSGLEEDTLVLFTTDHGIAFPHMKCNLYDTGIGVAMILRFPGNRMAGHASDLLLSQVDVYPTLCDLLGLKKPAHLQGVSFAGLFAGETAPVRTAVFSEVTYHAAYEPMRAVRTERYKLIRLFDADTSPVPANIDDCPSKDFLVSSGLLEETRAPVQLYDLYLDPVERVNRAEDPRYAGVRAELEQLLEGWMERTGDPLLYCAGRVPAPPGAMVNVRASLSPTGDIWE